MLLTAHHLRAVDDIYEMRYVRKVSTCTL